MSNRILCIEDDAAQARLFQTILQKADYAVDIASDGEMGLARCAAESYDAVIVDQTMPGLSGLDVIRELQNQEPPPPTIMVTGTGDELIAVEAMKAGASDYVVKDAAGRFLNVLPLVVGKAIEQHRTLQENRRMEQELLQARKLRAIGQLAAGIAHEINTPTQYIGDNTRFLRDAFKELGELLDAYGDLLSAADEGRPTSDAVKHVKDKLASADFNYLAKEIPQAVQQSLEGLDQVANIVSAMREFSYPDGGRMQAVDLNHTIEGAVALCRSEWKQVADITLDLDYSLPPLVCVAPDVQRVLVNLLINAAHATAEASHGEVKEIPTITVRTRRDGDWAEIRVEDHGTGIAPEIRDRVFDPFFTTKDVGQGTGQGLSIAHAIVVEKHHGSIRFDTQVGRGTTFIVRLPLHATPDDQPAMRPVGVGTEVETVY